jgi:hypothetical protein
MLFTCVRCGAPAAAAMSFDYPERSVWLNELEDGVAGGYVLCGRHADRLTPPLGWTLTDRRNVTRLFAPVAAPEVA